MKKIISIIALMTLIISNCINIYAMDSIQTSFQIWTSNDKETIESTEVEFDDGSSMKCCLLEMAGIEYI